MTSGQTTPSRTPLPGQAETGREGAFVDRKRKIMLED